MGTLLATYAVAWAAVAAYVTALAIKNKQIARRLEQLEQIIGDESEGQAAPKGGAAAAA